MTVYILSSDWHNHGMAGWVPELWSFLLGDSRDRMRIGAQDWFGLLPLSVSLRKFNTHLYVVGQSGQGKSKFLQHLLHQLASSPWGCGLFDPHSDLASDLLAQLASADSVSGLSGNRARSTGSSSVSGWPVSGWPIGGTAVSGFGKRIKRKQGAQHRVFIGDLKRTVSPSSAPQIR